MNLVGYLIVLISFNVVFTMQSNTDHISSISIQSGPVEKLARIVENLPDFSLDGFRSDRFYRVRDVGKYLSQNLLYYMRYGNVNPREDGIILTVHYSDSLPPLTARGSTVGYLFGKEPYDSDTTASLVGYMRSLHRNKRNSKK